MTENLVNFGNFFSVFGALNLAYASSQKFRDMINDDILQLNLPTTELEALFEPFKHLQQDHPTIYGEVHASVLGDIEYLYYQTVSERKQHKEFINYYKEMFFVSAIYCIIMLLFIGFEKFYPENFINILFYSNSIVLLILYIFLSGFFNKKTKTDLVKPLNSTIALICTIGLILMSIALSEYKLFDYELRYVIWGSITISILPYIFFFGKAFLYNWYNKKANKIYKKKIISEVAPTLYLKIVKAFTSKKDSDKDKGSPS